MQRITGTIYAGCLRNLGATGNGAFAGFDAGGSSGASGSASSAGWTFNSANSPGARAGDETRGRNVALLPCIKY
jgi:hypothetical protein